MVNNRTFLKEFHEFSGYIYEGHYDDARDGEFIGDVDVNSLHEILKKYFVRKKDIHKELLTNPELYNLWVSSKHIDRLLIEKGKVREEFFELKRALQDKPNQDRINAQIDRSMKELKL